MPAMESARTITDFVNEMTDGKPYIFVIMQYKEDYGLFRNIKMMVEEAVGFKCIRADDVHASGHELRGKIHLLIDRADMIIAEISTSSPNVFYEVGYTVGINKPCLLLAREGTSIPTDLKGLETISHKDDREGLEKLSKSLEEHLRINLNSKIPILRDMLLATEPLPAYILASPRYPAKEGRLHGQVFDQRTFSDNLGILGLISAFGSMVGERNEVELISSQFCDPNIIKRDINLYLIGSPKVNPVVKTLLGALQKGMTKKWMIEPRADKPKDEDIIYRLYEDDISDEGWIRGEIKEIPSNKEGIKGIIHTIDHGIVIRGPHPFYPKRVILIMAGAHSLGTGAACLAATKTALIRKFQAALPNKGDFTDKSRTIWALVKGVASKKDYLLDENGVSILRAGSYDER